MENNSVGQQGEESIPQDIQEKIDKAADDYGFVDTYDGINIIYDQQAVLAFEHGARFGYRLAATPPVSDGKEIEKALAFMEYAKDSDLFFDWEPTYLKRSNK